MSDSRSVPRPPEGIALQEEAEAVRRLSAAHRHALAALSAAQIPFIVLRAPVIESTPPCELDVLLSSHSLGQAARVLRGAQFLPKTIPLGIPGKVVFTTYENDRFHSMDVHTSVVSRGLVYMDGDRLLRRQVNRHGIPLPSCEDTLLHLVLHSLLGKCELGGKYRERIRQLASLPLEEEYMRQHLARHGLGPVFQETLAGILGKSNPEPSQLRRRARRQLLRRTPSNLLRNGRFRLAHRVRFRRRAALVAFVGVDGVGKSALVAALDQRLRGGGLRTSSVYMGCWGRFQTKAMWVRSYSPHDSPPSGESKLQATVRAFKNLGKFFLFYGGILVEQGVRYRRGVVRTSSHLVLSDRYLYDLELPFSRRYVRSGRRLRRLIYRWFPAPDIIFHLQAEPAEIRLRKAELEVDQMERFEATYREILSGSRAIPFQVEGTPEELAARITRQYWKNFLQACWRHAPPSPLRRLVAPYSNTRE